MSRRWCIRQGVFLYDFMGMAPGGGRWGSIELGLLKRQVAASQCFALAWVRGDCFCAGGFWPNPTYPERMAWMLWRPKPPARAMIEGVREILRALPPGPPVNAYCDADDPARARYLEAVGFRPAEGPGSLSSADLRAPMLPARVLRMEWP